MAQYAPVCHAFEMDEFSIVRSNIVSDLPDHTTPTLLASQQSQYLYSYFNERLFGGRLPECMITHMRHKSIYGWFAPKKLVKADGTTCHEIALNISFYDVLGFQEYCQTLVHEMCHLEQEEFGPWPRGRKTKTSGYHNKQWAAIMERVGLCPSSTGKPGGRQTGYGIADYVIEGGQFDLAQRELAIAGFEVTWRDHLELDWLDAGANSAARDATDVAVVAAKPKKDRVRFTCPSCSLNAWAKPSVRLTCTVCVREMISNNKGGAS